MAKREVLPAEHRDITGKRVKRLIRGKGKIPGVVYGKGLEPYLVSVNAKEFRRLYHEVGGSSLVDLTVGEERHPVLIHEPDNDPISGDEIHVDFYRVNMKEKITAEVPIHFTGEAPAVHAMEGTLIKNLDAIEVECLPADLPSEFEIDLAPLVDFEAAIHISDLSIPEGVELKVEAEETIARVEPPRSDEELEELEEAPEEDIEAVEGMEGAGEETENADLAEPGLKGETGGEDKPQQVPEAT
jgi:large subunit ribosomal protein L25